MFESHLIGGVPLDERERRYPARRSGIGRTLRVCRRRDRNRQREGAENDRRCARVAHERALVLDCRTRTGNQDRSFDSFGRRCGEDTKVTIRLTA